VASSGWVLVVEVAVGTTDELGVFIRAILAPELDTATTTAREPKIPGRILCRCGNSFRTSLSLLIMIVCILFEVTTEKVEEFLAPQ
jgi:hypothetical protein